MRIIATGSMLLRFVVASFVFLSISNNGNAGITSTYIRPEFPSADIPLDSELLAPPKGYNAPEQVCLTQGDYDGRAVIITWVTPDEPGSNIVQYGTAEKKYEFTAEGTVSNYTFDQYKSGFMHRCLVDDLEYDTLYHYKLGSGSSARKFRFKTPPSIGPDVPYKFGIIGDLGQSYNSLSTLAHYEQSKGEAVLYLGDLSYADLYQGNDIGLRWDSWGRLIENSTAYQPWIWSVGNHELEFMLSKNEVTPFKNFLQRYATPHLASQSNDPLWYAIRRASAHIIALCNYCPFAAFTPQWFWLIQELMKVDREKTPWLIVIMHIPIYSSNEAHYLQGESMRAEFESWFVQFKVDVVFAGHVHAYERSYRISNIRYNSTNGDCSPVPDKSAPLYITVGDGGNKQGLAEKFFDPQPAYSAFREASYGHSTLEIKNRTHALFHSYRNDNGNRIIADAVLLHNQFWASNQSGRKLKKHYLSTVV